MSEKPQDVASEAEKSTVTLAGTVEKIIPSVHPEIPEKAQIAIEGADHLYREIRVENMLHDDEGKAVALKPGAEVEVTIQADADDTIPKTPSESSPATHRSRASEISS